MPYLTKRTVDALEPQAKPYFIWDGGDRSVKGFGVMVAPSGLKSFVFKYRAHGQQGRLTIGRYGEMTIDQARERATRHKVAVADGINPLEERRKKREAARAEKLAATMGELFDRYLTEHVAVNNASKTQASVTALIERHIRPAIGNIRVKDFARKHAAELHYGMRATPRQANLALAVVSKAVSLAEQWGIRPENSNPCGSVKRYPENHRERFLTGAEIGRLGQAIEEAETIGLPWPEPKPGKTPSKHLPREENRRAKLSWQAITGIRLLLLTGARLGEIISLNWKDVNFDEGWIALPGRKGGARRPHPIGDAALEILRAIDPVEGSLFVLPRTENPERHVSAEVLEHAWQRIRARAEIEDVRLHDLRHTVGTFAAQAGVSGFIVRDLLRHKNISTTARYANFDANPVRQVSNIVGERIQGALAQSAEQMQPAKLGDKN
jgi:integrase